MSKLTVCFTTLCLLAAPAIAAPREPAVEVAKTQRAGEVPGRRPASPQELEHYAQREKASAKVAKFEGGRGRYIEATTLVIVLLVVILVILIV